MRHKRRSVITTSGSTSQQSSCNGLMFNKEGFDSGYRLGTQKRGCNHMDLSKQVMMSTDWPRRVYNEHRSSARCRSGILIRKSDFGVAFVALVARFSIGRIQIMINSTVGLMLLYSPIHFRHSTFRRATEGVIYYGKVDVLRALRESVTLLSTQLHDSNCS